MTLLMVAFLAGMWLLVRGEQAEAPSNVDEAFLEDDSAESKSVTNHVSTVEVYDGISVSSNVTELDLSGRQLSGSLKAEVRHLTELEVLDVSNNSFTGLPAEVGQLSNLRILNLSNNMFTGLPYELGNLQNLEVLDLRSTPYATQDLSVIQEMLPNTTVVLTD
jgi:Leucine-rich repeat (LRR) protein